MPAASPRLTARPVNVPAPGPSSRVRTRGRRPAVDQHRIVWRRAGQVPFALGGNADVETVRVAVTGHDRARADHATRTDGDPAENDRSRPDPAALAHGDGCDLHFTAPGPIRRRAEGVRGSQKPDARPNRDIGSELDVGPSVEKHPDVDEDAVMHGHVVPAHEAHVREDARRADVYPAPAEQANAGRVEKIGLAATLLSHVSRNGLMASVKELWSVRPRQTTIDLAVLPSDVPCQVCPNSA